MVIQPPDKLKTIIRDSTLFAPLLGITSITAVSTIALTSPLSSALDTKSVGASVRVAEACSITASDSGTATPDNPYEIIGGTYAPSVKTVTMDIYCNDKNGYSLYAVGYGYNNEGVATEGITTMNSSTPGSTNTIPTGTDTSTDVSNWSFKLSPVSGTFAPSILSDSAGSFSNYHAIPDHQTKVATFTDTIDVTTASTLTSTYAVAVSPYQTPDVYTGQVKYTLVHPNYAAVDGSVEEYTITIATGGDVMGVTVDGTYYTNGQTITVLQNSEHTINAIYNNVSGHTLYWKSTPAAGVAFDNAYTASTNFVATGDTTITANTFNGTLMQALDQTSISALLPSTGSSATVYDARDEQAYTIKKLADNKYWMTTSLNLAGGTTVTGNDSNLAKGDSFTLPASATKNASDNNLTDSTQFSDNNKADGYVFNSGNTTNCGASGQNVPCGSYYSFMAATAGGKDANGNVVTDSGYNTAYSICPKGWRLPTATTSNAAANSNNNWKTGDFYALATAYGADLSGKHYVNSGSTASAFYNNAGPGTTPNFLLAGWYSVGWFGSGGSYGGIYWSATSSSSTGAYYLSFNSGGVGSSYSGSRQGGFPVRCIFGA